MKHNNPTIVERANRIFNPKGSDSLPDEVTGIIANVPLHPVVNFIAQDNTTASGTRTIFTTPTDRDVYITAINFSYAKNAACDAATGIFRVRAFMRGLQRDIAGISDITLTASTQQISLSFPYPLKIDRNTAVDYTGTFTAGVLARNINIYYYEEDVNK